MLRKRVIIIVVSMIISISIVFAIMQIRNVRDRGVYETGTGTYVLNKFENDLMLNAFRGRLLPREEQAVISSDEELNEHLYGDRNYPTVIISSYDEFLYLYNQLHEGFRRILPLEIYSMEFFENKSLVIIGVMVQDERSTIGKERAILSNNTVVISYEARRPTFWIGSTGWYTIIVEMPKGVDDIIVERTERRQNGSWESNTAIYLERARRISDLNESKIILSTHDEHSSYFGQFSMSGMRYSSNPGFFDHQSLAVIYVTTQYRGNIVEKSAIIEGDTVKISYKFDMAEGLPTDTAFFIIVEIPNNVNEIIVDSNR